MHDFNCVFILIFNVKAVLRTIINAILELKPRSRKWGHEMLWIAEDLRGFIRDAAQLKVTPTAEAMWEHVLDLYPNIKPVQMTAFRLVETKLSESIKEYFHNYYF